MLKQEMIEWFAGFCPTIELDNDKIYLDRDHLLVYLLPSDNRLSIVSEQHDAKTTYLINNYNYDTMEKLVAIWSEFVELNN